MQTLTLPAPLWRRLAAAVYDGLLVLAICMVVLALTVIIFSYAPVPQVERVQKLLMGLGVWYYFVHSWSRGGQTLGMRAWRLRLRGGDGQTIGLLAASIRFVLMAVLCLLPVIIGGGAAWLHGWRTDPWALLLALPVLSMGWALLPGRRALHDRLSRSEVVSVPAPPRRG